MSTNESGKCATCGHTHTKGHTLLVHAIREAERSAGAAPLDADVRRFVDHVGGLHCDEYHPEGTCEWQLRCDEPKCKREVTCGYPTDNGYRRTCGAHALLYEGTEVREVEP